MIAVFIGLLVVLLMCSGTLSASETSMFSLSSMKIKAYKSSPDQRHQLIARLVSCPRKLLVTILMLNVLMNILVQNVVSSLFGTFSGVLLTVFVPLILVLLFGEVIPKTIAIANNEKIAYRVAPILGFVEKSLGFVRDGIVAFTTPLSRITFFFLQREKEISLSELKHALRTSREFGVMESEEANLVRGFLNLEDFVAKEVMCPRQDILWYNINDPLSELVHLFVKKECSRVPVCDGDVEQMLGVITSKDFFLNRQQISSTDELKQFLTKPIYIPETMPSKDVLKHIYKHHQGLIFVVDEYSSICGLVTLEDLVEVVVGQIEDKKDSLTAYTVVGKEVIISSGKMELAELEELFDIKLSSVTNMVTVGGWLTEQFGDIPQAGAKHVTQNFLFHVLSADPQRVRRVYIRRIRQKKGERDG